MRRAWRFTKSLSTIWLENRSKNQIKMNIHFEPTCPGNSFQNPWPLSSKQTGALDVGRRGGKEGSLLRKWRRKRLGNVFFHPEEKPAKITKEPEAPILPIHEATDIALHSSCPGRYDCFFKFIAGEILSPVASPRTLAIQFQWWYRRDSDRALFESFVRHVWRKVLVRFGGWILKPEGEALENLTGICYRS